jgi:hypothetical protein
MENMKAAIPIVVQTSETSLLTAAKGDVMVIITKTTPKAVNVAA